MKLRLALYAILGLVACGGGEDTPTGPAGPATLETEDIVVGTGAVAVVGDRVSVNYVGTFLNGVQFDGSAGPPLQFEIDLLSIAGK